MQLYYTGADQFFQVQTNTDKSIGGWMSSSILKNHSMGNLFSDISYLSIQNSSVETKALILINEHPDGELTNVEFYFDQEEENPLCTYEVAFTTLQDSNKRMEKIGNFRSSPLYATFSSAQGVDNKILVKAAMPLDDKIGIWIRRTVSSSLLELSCDEASELISSIPKEGAVTLNFSFD